MRLIVNHLPLSKFAVILCFMLPQWVAGQPPAKPLYKKAVYFGFNKWDIEKGEEKNLLAVVRAIKAQKQPYYITITGHTDNVDNDRYNYELGMKRARAVAQFLIKRGADSSLITLHSKGEAASKKTDADSLRSLDRRVEIALYKKIAEIKDYGVRLRAIMIDSVSGKQVKGQILVLDKAKANITPGDIYIDTSTVTIPILAGVMYEISYSAKGFRTKNITYTFHDSVFKKPNTVTTTIGLVKAVIKSKKNFDKVYFYGGESRFLPSSGPELQKILKYAKSDGVSAIEIVGHVNHPYNLTQTHPDIPGINYRLSFMRAKAVYDFLIENGVDGRVISYKGVSNTEMKFPYATDENQMAQNRRVEVLILEE